MATKKKAKKRAILNRLFVDDFLAWQPSPGAKKKLEAMALASLKALANLYLNKRINKRSIAKVVKNHAAATASLIRSDLRSKLKK